MDLEPCDIESGPPLHHFSHFHALMSAAALLLAAGCSSSAASTLVAPVGDASIEAAAPDAAGLGDECLAGETQDCDCVESGAGEGTGYRGCADGFWGAACIGCESVKAKKLCVPGFYEGIGTMEYVPGPAGLCGVATLFGGTGDGAFTFRLKEDDLGEFAAVRDGCFGGSTENAMDATGAAGVVADGVETRSAFTGTVDCSTGELVGEVTGSYDSVSVCGLGVVEDTFFFKGWITATYNPDTEGFEGLILVREPEVSLPLSGQPGGVGDWSATRTDNPTMMLPEGEECLLTPFEDFEVELPPVGEIPEE